MRIKSIQLENIRSYINQKIEFPEGSSLLTGDIGSGKSTILLALEFVLFGVRKPSLTGASLLRYGSNTASVALDLEIDGKEVHIKRNLKKSSGDIKQGPGLIIIDGVKSDGTAIELKSKIIELFGYPRDMLTKHKDIIYRYTVYTPQEEMKAILFEDSEARLNTLRRVFGIDKYKRIRENSIVYLRELKSRQREFHGRIFDLSDKIREKEEFNDELMIFQKQIDKLKPGVETAKTKVTELKTKLAEYEDDINSLNILKKDLAIIESEQHAILQTFSRNSSLNKQINIELQGLKQESNNQDLLSELDIQSIIKGLEAQSLKNDVDLSKITLEINRLENEGSLFKAVITKVKDLNMCPTCEQVVSIEHRHKITGREEKKIHERNLLKKGLESKQYDLKKNKEEISTGLLEQRGIEKQMLVYKEKEKLILEKKKNVSRLEEDNITIKKSLGNINQKKMQLNSEIAAFKDIETRLSEIKNQLDSELKIEKDLEISYEGLKKNILNCEERLKNLKNEIDIKIKVKKEIKVISGQVLWLNNFFNNLMITMEKHVMAQLYQEFNSCFVSWFSVLIDDEMMIARLDDGFSPIIEQNGYETDLINLSGGEKTSVALAYRLALNKVINDYISHIKTRDILILDEPTDGFSHEQLDRMRDLLEELNLKQTIIVSHESKIEGFVDNVMRITKRDHISIVDN